MTDQPKEKTEKVQKSVQTPTDRDEKVRPYYYDDAHGYEEYDPDSEVDENEEDAEDDD